MTPGQAKLAVLIDADNAQPGMTEALLSEIAKYGAASVKRIYGDWTLPNLRSWKDLLAVHAIQPVQQFRYTVGKNSTDSAMIIDAMDLLYTERFDGFCLVTSDSDFTRLASRVREAGLMVYGFGEKKTPQSLVSACDKFIYIEVLRAAAETPESGEEEAPRGRDSASLKRDAKLVRLFRDALEAGSDEDGWAQLGSVGSFIANQAPDFDPRNYGFRKLRELVSAMGLFEIEERRIGEGAGRAVYIRQRQRSAGAQRKTAAG
jgi:uncharacterized LabA/DUF88 family protein